MNEESGLRFALHENSRCGLKTEKNAYAIALPRQRERNPASDGSGFAEGRRSEDNDEEGSGACWGLGRNFPNKSSLLDVLFRQQLDSFAIHFEEACTAVRGAELAEMAEVLASAFVKSKFGDAETSIALYATAGGSDGCRRMRTRTAKVLADTISTASDRTVADPSQVARMLLSAMAGISRDIIASGLGRNTMIAMERELAILLRSYLLGSSTSKSSSETESWSSICSALCVASSKA